MSSQSYSTNILSLYFNRILGIAGYMKSMQSLFTEYNIVKKGKPNSERSFLIQEIADMTGMPFMVIFGKTNHLSGPAGTKAIKDIYEDALRYSTENKWRCIKFWMLLKESKNEQRSNIIEG